MGEPKAFASLSSGLLARKGAARPAMRPQGFGQVGSGLEDLGWNDMGFEPPKPAIAPVRDDDHDAFGEELPDQPLRNPLAALTPIASPVHDQQAEIAERFAAHDEDGEDDEDEYVDETAELYDPEAEDAAPVEPSSKSRSRARVRAGSPCSVAVLRLRSRCRCAGSGASAPPARRAGKQGQGRVHAAPRSGAPPEAAPCLRRHRPLGPAIGDRCARPAARRMPELELDGRAGAGKRAEG